MLRNDVVGALERRDAQAAFPACETVELEYPRDDSLPALRLLAQAGVPAADPAANHGAVRDATQAIEQSVAPAAVRIFGASAAAGWLAVLWRQLADRAA